MLYTTNSIFLERRIFELRARRGNVNYRILCFFHGKDVAVLAHGLTKEGEVPEVDIHRVIRRRSTLGKYPERHIYQEEDLGEGSQDE